MEIRTFYIFQNLNNVFMDKEGRIMKIEEKLFVKNMINCIKYIS